MNFIRSKIPAVEYVHLSRSMWIIEEFERESPRERGEREGEGKKGRGRERERERKKYREREKEGEIKRERLTKRD